MLRPVTPSSRIVGLSIENLNTFDELEDVAEEFIRTPRLNVTNSPLPEIIEVSCANVENEEDTNPLGTPRSETGSLLITECNELLPEDQRVPRSRCSTARSRQSIKG